MKVPGCSSGCALASPVWDYRCPDPTFQRALIVKRIRPFCLHLHSNKAVAQGAIAFFLDTIVTSRVSRFEYGLEVNVVYNPYNTQHAVRSSKAAFMADGIKRLPNGFSTILDEVCSQAGPVVSKFLTDAREPGSPRRRNSGDNSSAPPNHDNLSIRSEPSLKLTTGALETRSGLIVTLVAKLLV